MPLTYREVFQIGLLLLCVPVQYFLSSSPQSDADKTQALVRLLHDMKELKESWFSIAAYKSLWYNIVAWFTQGKCTPSSFRLTFVALQDFL